MADGIDKLLMYIVDHKVMQSESRTAEMEASAVQDVPAEVKSIAEDQRGDAARLSQYFAAGLRLASANNGVVTVDDTDPMGNGIADAFARFLVVTDLATSSSEDIADGHYRYTFEVDWPRLSAIAQQAGIDLNSALGSDGRP
jgi:hypothetical protein